MPAAEWTDPDRAARWLNRRDQVPRQDEVARVIFEDVIAGRRISRILDLGTGDGRAIAGLLAAFPDAEAVGVDFSPPLLARARERFADRTQVQIVEHDLNEPLPPHLSDFDLLISVQAIHHLPDDRKRSLYRESLGLLRPDGLFCNVDLVASPTEALFKKAMGAYGLTEEDVDPTDQPAPVEPQLHWLREAGFIDVDCYWKWLSSAVMVGVRPMLSA
jgi:SAM-dependent methyltransferase